MKKKITLVAPSYLLDAEGQEKISKSIEELKKLGYEINLSKHLNEDPNTTPKDKAEDLLAAFNDDSDIIWSVAGGEGMIDTIKCLDFDLIKDSKKLFIGFSDNTCLTYTLTTTFDIPTIVAHNAKGMRNIDKQDVVDTLRMIEGEKDFSTYDYWDNEENDKNKPDLKFINFDKPVTGIILGGCVEVLKELQDAGIDNTLNFVNRHKDEGIIFFFDNFENNPEILRNNLESFKANHWFDNVSLFICSRGYCYFDDEIEKKLNDVYLETLGTLNKPIVLNADIGHMDPLLPMYLGKKCMASKENKRLYFRYK